MKRHSPWLSCIEWYRVRCPSCSKDAGAHRESKSCDRSCVLKGFEHLKRTYSKFLNGLNGSVGFSNSLNSLPSEVYIFLSLLLLHLLTSLPSDTFLSLTLWYLLLFNLSFPLYIFQSLLSAIA